MISAKRNILLIIADDLGKYVGAYGCKSVRTPHLDQLAQDGTRFDNAFASTASCSGSRSTIYTGLHTHENGQYGLVQYRTHFQTFDHIDTLPALFNHAGYLTGIIGKIHVGDKPTYPWTVQEPSPSRDVAWVSDRCEAFFDRAKRDHQPFFLTVGFHDPHRDQTRSDFANEQTFGPGVKAITVQPDEVEIPVWLSDVPELREELCDYYRAIHRCDQGVGFILEKLANSGLDDTLVIFMSDNGPPFINAKTTLYDAGTCLPLIIRAPSVRGGVVNPNMVSWIDILPTAIDWAGLDPRIQLNTKSPLRRGRSILPILERADVVEPAWRQSVFCSHTFHQRENYWPTRVIRTPRYKYHRNIAWRLQFPFATDLYVSKSWEGIRNTSKPVHIGHRALKDYIFRPDEQLFDMVRDPGEVKNLATDAAYEDVLNDLRKQLELWQQDTEDPWLVRDGVSLVDIHNWIKEPIMVPDRFDFDVEEPGTRDVAHKLMQAQDPIS